jgi:hypothetical protein
MHVVARVAFENFPAEHAWHVRLSSYLPSRQEVHQISLGAPRTRLYVPAGQGRQSWMEPL